MVCLAVSATQQTAASDRLAAPPVAAVKQVRDSSIAKAAGRGHTGLTFSFSAKSKQLS